MSEVGISNKTVERLAQDMRDPCSTMTSRIAAAATLRALRAALDAAEAERDENEGAFMVWRRRCLEVENGRDCVGVRRDEREACARMVDEALADVTANILGNLEEYHVAGPMHMENKALAQCTAWFAHIAAAIRARGDVDEMEAGR